jgi:serine/threonine protein kinase
MQPAAVTSSPHRVLFPGCLCRSETKDYKSPISSNELLGKVHAVLGLPSEADIDEFACVAGQAVRASSFSEAAAQQAELETRELLVKGDSRLVTSPVDFNVKYSKAGADIPSALSLLSQMLCYSPSKRISCSQALRHEFLNPGHADVTVDSTVGDDGHERAKRTAVKLKQLNIEGLCSHSCARRDRAVIAQLLRTESELIKFPDMSHVGGHVNANSI